MEIFDFDNMRRKWSIIRYRNMVPIQLLCGLLRRWNHCRRETSENIRFKSWAGRRRCRLSFGTSLARTQKNFHFFVKTRNIRIRGISRLTSLLPHRIFPNSDNTFLSSLSRFAVKNLQCSQKHESILYTFNLLKLSIRKLITDWLLYDTVFCI